MNNVSIPPTALEVRSQAIPEDLSQLPWTPWRYISREDGWGKIPRRTDDKDVARVNDVAAWSSLDAALESYANPPWASFDGIGVLLPADSRIMAVDIDNCFSGGRLEDWALKIVCDLNSYTEISPSGNGLRIFVKGQIPPAVGAFRKYHLEKQVGHNVAVYRKGFLTVTGQTLKGFASIRDSDRLLPYFSVLEKAKAEQNQAKTQSPSKPTGLPPRSLEDSVARLQKARAPLEQGDGSTKLFTLCCWCIEWFQYDDRQIYDTIIAYHAKQPLRMLQDPAVLGQVLRQRIHQARAHIRRRGLP